MESSVNIKEEHWILICEISWDIDESNIEDVFNTIYDKIWKFQPTTKIILNLHWLKYLNSKAIWYIFEIHSNITENNWDIYISNCTPTLKDTLNLVGITGVFKIVEDYKEAMNKMGGISLK
jgi:anti-anti-sigma factor